MVQTPPVQTLYACRRVARCPAGAMQVQIGPQIEMLRGDFEDSTAAGVTWQARHTLRLHWQYPCSLHRVYFQRPAACKPACFASLQATQQPVRHFTGPCANCSSHSVLRPPTNLPTHPVLSADLRQPHHLLPAAHPRHRGHHQGAVRVSGALVGKRPGLAGWSAVALGEQGSSGGRVTGSS